MLFQCLFPFMKQRIDYYVWEGVDGNGFVSTGSERTMSPTPSFDLLARHSLIPRNWCFCVRVASQDWIGIWNRNLLDSVMMPFVNSEPVERRFIIDNKLWNEWLCLCAIGSLIRAEASTTALWVGWSDVVFGALFSLGAACLFHQVNTVVLHKNVIATKRRI